MSAKYRGITLLTAFARRSYFDYQLKRTFRVACGYNATEARSGSKYRHGSSDSSRGANTRLPTSAAILCITGGVLTYQWLKSRTSPYASCESAEQGVGGQRRDDLPDYKLSEISTHKTPDTKIWVTFRNGVYDITDFIAGHPGGDRIKLASGGPLEPFWELYGVHKTAHVFDILETLRIGNVHPDDLKATQAQSVKSDDPYSHEPQRHPALHVHVPKPFNAETPSQLLVDNYITPNSVFFVRNHLPVPLLDVASTSQADSKVELSGYGIRRPINLSVADLKKKFKVHTVTTALPCAGNRRKNMDGGDQPVRGLQWDVGAVGNARWTGVYLSDVLAWAGAKEDDVKHVIFQGKDKDLEGLPYEASIPAETAFDRRREVLLAFEMNGEPIPLDHGYPVRVIVPGSIGARQVKWLSKIVLSREESNSFWQKKDYKTVSPAVNWDKTDLERVAAIQDFPVQSAICLPADEAVVDRHGDIDLKGYAMSGGGRGILRVDITTDGGKTWHEASVYNEAQAWGRQWSWVLWEASVPLPRDIAPGSKVEIAVKATDTSHNTQPESDVSVWNIRGLLENKWHRIHVYVDSN